MRLVSLLSAAVLLSSVCAAHAAVISPASEITSVINFNTLPGTNGDPFSSYTEDGFTVTNSAGQYLVGTVYGDPVPSLFSGYADSDLGATTSAAVTITANNGGDFTFDSAALANDVGAGLFQFTGDVNGKQVYSQVGFIGGDGRFETYASTSPSLDLTSLTISEVGGDFNVDNITLSTSVTPEPSSLLLLGTGLLGVVGTVRRRLA